MNARIVESLSDLLHLENPEEGQVYYCTKESKMYIYADKTLTIFKAPMESGFDMNLYEMNKMIVNQLEPLTIADISNKIQTIEQYYDECSDRHHMLLCREYNYYTIFELDPMLPLPTFSGAVCGLITELGEVYSIEKVEGAMEIWIKPEGVETPLAFYLFPYDGGVVYYG